jgi:hypothetical protein
MPNIVSSHPNGGSDGNQRRAAHQKKSPDISGLSWWQKDYPNGSSKISSIITINTGCANLHIDISAAEARALAASLIAHANDVEATQQQIDLLESMPA